MSKVQPCAEAEVFECRPLCGACCIAPSINKPFYGMPEGKPAGVTCLHLLEDLRCGLFDDPRRPQACLQFTADPLICGSDRGRALNNLQILELDTRPADVPDRRLL